jgi:DNA-binding MarR family transcriptional regulator
MEKREDKIVFILERLSHLFRQIAWEISYDASISPLQFEILLFLKEREERERRVSTIAEAFGITKATVSDAVKVLQEKGFVSLNRWEEDRRVKLISLTKKGKELVRKGEGIWGERTRAGLSVLSMREKEDLFLSLLKTVAGYQKTGVLRDVRMCLTCRNFEKDAFPGAEKPHRCKLTGERLGVLDLRVHCEKNTSL